MKLSDNGEITKEQIRELLEGHYNKVYGASIIKRPLLTYKAEGCYFFVLRGTPPKGYAIYVPESQMLYLYELEGKKFKEITVKEIIDLN